MTPEDLVELELIKQLKYRYMRGLDTHDFELLRSCFTEDVTTDYDAGSTIHTGGGSFARTGRDDLIELLQNLISHTFIGNHVATHPEITLLEPGKARGIWRMEDRVHYLAENPLIANPGDSVHGNGHYYDEYVKVAGEWKIKHTGYVRIFEQIRRGDKDVLVVTPALGVKRGWV